ncbi:pyrimidine-nucleoside phosphorylase [Clostridia bacterium]|nr:pyrimidine-nucleoside phosphorylase [Clostridia bacterium]
MLNMLSIISKKRDGMALNREEIEYFVENYTSGEIPDYQAAALLMAIYFKQLTSKEIFILTDAMMRSGDIIDLSGIGGIKVDKHSTGGVGDKTTFIAAPLVAACGVPVAKMSGRGLGFTGGTVDKMESIPGMKTTLESGEFFSLVNAVGISVIGQTGRLAPADKKLYALRDVTATVDVLGLIASSVMSKKLASGADALVLDVKCGSGAFMGTEEAARELAGIMVDIGAMAGKKVIAAVTNMDQPLGFAVGNSLEMIEVIETLKGRGPKDITEISLGMAAFMIYAGEKSETVDEAYGMAGLALKSGAGLKKLSELIRGQGGNDGVIDDYSLFPQAGIAEVIRAKKDGFISGINAKAIGLASQKSGAGRERKDDVIDLSAGIVIRNKLGDMVKVGDELAVVYGNDELKVRESALSAGEAFAISDEKVPEKEMILAVISNIKGLI